MMEVVAMDGAVLFDESQMQRWGERLGSGLRPPLFIVLRGDLGAGKSTLARAVARGAGVEDTMPSPTFNLLFRYPGTRGVTVVHIDLYRLDDPDEVWELGWEDLPAGDEVVLVEWPERAEAFLPSDRWEIRLEAARGGSARRMTVSTLGSAAPFPVLEEEG